MGSNGVPANQVLVRLDSACKELAEAKRVEDVLELRDKSQAALHYMKQQRYGKDLMMDGAEFKLRAERRLGELLAETARPGNPQLSHDVTIGRLPDGVSRMDSHRWQRMASIPTEAFEEHVAQIRDAGQELTTASVLRLAKELQQPGKRKEPPLADGCTVDDLHALVDGGEKFGAIYADPPWRYGNQATRAATDNHYGTMTVEEIAALPVGELADDCCHLHLWTTNAFLFECPRLFEAWGFTYQGVFVWCKPQMGIGNCWRVSHEFLLLAIRGEPRRFRNRSLMSWAAIDRDAHSVKPEAVQLMIEKASPPAYLELFGRRARKGWTVWGNEISRDLFHMDVKRR